MNWNTVLSTILSGAVIGFADTYTGSGHVDKHTLITAGIGAILALANLLRPAPTNPPTGK